MTLSAEFSVEGDSSVTAHEVNYGDTVNLALVSDNGVNVVAWSIQGTSHESFTAPTITPAGSPSGKTASFAMPADPGGGEGRSVLIKCTVTDSALNQAVAYRVVGVANDVGVVPIAAGEENHRSATHGWIEPVNTALAAVGGGGSLSSPADPADDGKLAYADSGDLSYSSGVKIVNGGDSLAVGATVAAAGDIRGSTSMSIVALSGANDMDLIKASSGSIIIGETTHAANVEIQAATSHVFDVGGSDLMTLTSSGLALGSTPLTASAVAITGGTISGAVNRVASSVSESVASAATSANIDIAIQESTSVSHVVQVRAEDASGHWTTRRVNVETRRSGSSAPVTSGPIAAFEYISSGTGVTINASISGNNLRISATNGMGADCHMTIRVWQVESDTTVEDS